MNTTTRRGFIRSACGATMGLPYLESFAGATIAAPAQRFAMFYVPIGVVRRGFFPGEEQQKLSKFGGADTPAVEGADYGVGVRDWKLAPTQQPLQELKDKLTLVTGMDRTFQSGTDVHAQCASCFLSSAAPNTVKHSAWPLDRTLDHVIADRIGGQTPFRSLEFSCNSHKDNKESMYFNNVSWYGTSHVAPSMSDPRLAYQRMFGTTRGGTAKRITDVILADARSMKSKLAYTDQQKFTEFFDAVRGIEKQVSRLEAMRTELEKYRMEEPTGTYLPRGEYIRLMSDLMVVALQSGLTNVATFMVGPERWDTPFTYDSLFDKPRSHHQMSHNPGKYVEDLLKVDKFHVAQFAYLVNRMASIREADGTTLLDNTLLTYGSGLGDGATHQYNDLPIILAGGAGGRLKHGRHLALQDGTPLANLWLTQARMMGVKRDRFADSTGPIKQLFDA